MIYRGRTLHRLGRHCGTSCAGIFYRGQEPSSNRVVVPARQAGGIDFLELIPAWGY
jgi:hypothetical protein